MTARFHHDQICRTLGSRSKELVDAVREDFERCYGAWWLTVDEETAKRLEQDATKRRRTSQSKTPG